AYSRSREMELDVEQLLDHLSSAAGVGSSSPERMPEPWREHARTDLECPCCFVTGAEIVREAVSSTSGRIVRQPCFRFPGHHHSPCDYASGDKDNVEPENLIRFGDAKSALTRAIRELFCTGIQMGAFSQRSIRDMRQWFFERKSE